MGECDVSVREREGESAKETGRKIGQSGKGKKKTNDAEIETNEEKVSSEAVVMQKSSSYAVMQKKNHVMR